MAGLRLLVWYGNGPGVAPSPENRPQEHVVTWRRVGPVVESLLHDMERSEGGGVRKIAVEAIT